MSISNTRFKRFAHVIEARFSAGVWSLPVGAMHGSPWAYDTHVKIIFSGPGIKAAKIHRLVHPIDVAPTLSALVGLSPPAAAQGEVLVEVVNNSDTGDR